MRLLFIDSGTWFVVEFRVPNIQDIPHCMRTLKETATQYLWGGGGGGLGPSNPISINGGGGGAFSHSAGTAPIITLFIPGTPLKTVPLQNDA